MPCAQPGQGQVLPWLCGPVFGCAVRCGRLCPNAARGARRQAPRVDAGGGQAGSPASDQRSEAAGSGPVRPASENRHFRGAAADRSAGAGRDFRLLGFEPRAGPKPADATAAPRRAAVAGGGAGGAGRLCADRSGAAGRCSLRTVACRTTARGDPPRSGRLADRATKRRQGEDGDIGAASPPRDARTGGGPGAALQAERRRASAARALELEDGTGHGRRPTAAEQPAVRSLQPVRRTSLPGRSPDGPGRSPGIGGRPGSRCQSVRRAGCIQRRCGRRCDGARFERRPWRKRQFGLRRAGRCILGQRREWRRCEQRRRQRGPCRERR